MGKTIGKVLATEKNPSTMEEFYFWTNPQLVLNPFDVVKVDHINDSTTYGVVEEISSNAFKVKLTNGMDIRATLAGKLRIHHIRILPGDKVKVEISPYDLTNGRIVYRNK